MVHPLRRLLWPASWLYGGAVRLRNARFDGGSSAVERLSVPVVSVGNLTVGGTGKTPLVVWWVERARALGRNPGVLARGYGRAPGAALNDEGAMLAGRFADLPQVQDPDRVRGGRALEAQGVDLIILDDGFQHRRLHRDRDLVCLDAREPFDGGLLLPAGDLREPPSGLRRADAVVLTRAGGLAAEVLDERVAAVRAAAGRDVAVFAAEHAPRDLLAMPSGEVLGLGRMAGQRVHAVSAIARPASFEALVGALGGRITNATRFRDHHRFTRAEVTRLAAEAAAAGAVLVVTEKDEAKLAGFDVPRWVLRVDLRFVGDAPPDAVLGLGG